MDPHERQSCIEVCRRCIQACDRCVSSGSHTESAENSAYLALAADCADFCRAAITLIERESRFVADVCRLGAEICDACAVESQRQVQLACQGCAAICHECADEFRRMIALQPVRVP